MLWLILALIGALATSLTTIFAKIGIKNVNSDFATFFREVQQKIFMRAGASHCGNGGYNRFQFITTGDYGWADSNAITCVPLILYCMS